MRFLLAFCETTPEGGMFHSVKIKVKVKVNLAQALRLCTGRKAPRGSRGTALTFHDHGTRRGWGVSVTPRPLFTPGKDQVPIIQEAGWAPGPVWTGVENLATTGIRSPDRPAGSESLYRLSYPAHIQLKSVIIFVTAHFEACLIVVSVNKNARHQHVQCAMSV